MTDKVPEEHTLNELDFIYKNLKGDHSKHTKEYGQSIDFNIKKKKWHWIQVSLVCVIKLLISLIALYLVWDCSQKENIIIRVINVIIAMIMPEFYIIYYAIYRVFLGNKCY